MSRIGNDSSLKAMQEALLDIKLKVNFMMKWVELGVGLVGSDGFNNGLVDKQKGIMGGGPISSVDCKKKNDQKGKTIVNGPGLVKSPKRVWKAKKSFNLRSYNFSFLFKHAGTSSCSDGL